MLSAYRDIVDMYPWILSINYILLDSVYVLHSPLVSGHVEETNEVMVISMRLL